MTTLIQNEQKRQKIMARMREHLVPVLEHCRGGWVGLFLQGSQNYNLDRDCPIQQLRRDELHYGYGSGKAKGNGAPLPCHNGQD